MSHMVPLQIPYMLPLQVLCTVPELTLCILPPRMSYMVPLQIPYMLPLQVLCTVPELTLCILPPRMSYMVESLLHESLNIIHLQNRKGVPRKPVPVISFASLQKASKPFPAPELQYR
ncbi:MAG TPA: hypothetical protein DCW47_09145 [Lachnospiraceae bacterium]|nr:hypothetical protein [Lachnospiraceae bacterium]